MTNQRFQLALFILILALIGFSFQNCQQFTQISLISDSELYKSDPLLWSNDSLASSSQYGGNGSGYDGKPTRFSFYLNVESQGVELPRPFLTGPYELDRALPRGLLFDPARGLIYGTPRELTEGFELFHMTAVGQSVNVSSGASIAFLLSVGREYEVTAPMSEMYLPDKDQHDGLCLTINGHCSLRAAVEQANANTVKSRIRLPAGHFYLSQNQFPLQVKKRMDIVGAGSGLTGTILDGENQVPILNMTSDDIELSGLRFIRGRKSTDTSQPGWRGGCFINNISSDVDVSSAGGYWAVLETIEARIEDVVFDSCHSSPGSGAGVAFQGHRLSLKKTHFISSRCGGLGCALYSLSNELQVLDSRFVDSRSVTGSYGGAIQVGGKKVEIKRSHFEGNVSSTWQAGGVSLHRSDFAVIEDSVFIGNRSESGMGGAIYAKDVSHLTIRRSRFEGNGSRLAGGGPLSYRSVSLRTTRLLSGARRKVLFSVLGHSRLVLWGE